LARAAAMLPTNSSSERGNADARCAFNTVWIASQLVHSLPCSSTVTNSGSDRRPGT